MRYWISFVDGQEGEAERVVDVCIVDADTKAEALTTARAVCQRHGRARVVLIPSGITLPAGDLGRRIPLDRVEALYHDIEGQLAAARRHGPER